ncbi:MAG TPA: VWA domain-containing protein [Rhizomicrobium sp.]
MGFDQFHFAQSWWLWGLIAIPAVLLLHGWLQKADGAERLEPFADRHLLPHLMKSPSATQPKDRKPLMLWAAAWLCGIIAMAGPRWGYTNEPSYEPSRDLVIVLDLSQSMNATDVKPSRVARAREEIEDIMDMSHDDSVGLVAYAAVPHMITPLTDDFRTIKALLPELDTSLVTIQGDRLAPALQMAAAMLKDETGDDKSILVISDGGFQENNINELAQAAGNAAIYTMGIGAPGSGLQASRLQALAAAGHGIYVEANYSDSDTRALLNRMGAANVRARRSAKTVRVWDERYYIPALLLALLLLPLFRKGATFLVVPLLVVMIFPFADAKADTVSGVFLNRNEQAKWAFDRGDYATAITKFGRPYQRGVVAYRMKQYGKAEVLFKTAAGKRPRLNALYDMGNAQLMQDEVEDAIASYRAALKLNADDIPTQHNLAIALKMLAQEQQKQNQQKQKQQPDNKGGGGQNKQQGKNGSQSPQNGAQSPAKTANRGAQQPAQPKAEQKAAQQQGQPKQGKPENAQQRAAQAAAARPAQPPGDKKTPPQYGAFVAPPRTQRDVNADQWLTRVQSDPGSFLKNQFRIEDQQSGLKQGTPQQ